jgi:hypothetical protein
MNKNVKIDEDYYLVSQEVNSNETVEIAKSVNHIIVIDVSGSMSYDLPLVRTQLKNKLPDLLGDSDTVSILWFSGNNESGILKEEVEVKSLKTLSDLNNAIDRWLQPIGLTAFHKPLVLVKEVIERIKKNRPASINSLLFFTDGYNNNCSWSDVIKALKNLENDLAASSFIEYGFYCNSKSITEMAATVGGSKISASSFDDYEPIFDSILSKSLSSSKKVVVDITDKYLYDFAFSVSDGSVLLYNIADNKIMVGGDVKEVHFFSPSAVGSESLTLPETALYAGIYVLSDRLLSDEAEKLFYPLGDDFYYKMLSNAFGKQKLNAFKSAIKDCVTDTAKRFPDGKGAIRKVDDNAYCFMNLIEDLGNIEDCRFYPNHSEFQYNRIGRKRVAVGSTLTDADKQRLAEAKDVKEASAIMKEFEDKKLDLKFVNTDPDRGYPLSSLVWNEKRANLSVLARIDGEVELPANKYGIDKIASFKFNTFTLVKDGIINVEKLPVTYSRELEKLLHDNNVAYTIVNACIVINLSSLPIVNRGMVKAISANALAKQEWELIKLQGQKKVYDFYRKQLFPKTSKSFVDMLSQECADWLKEVGITDYNGFAPKVTFAEATDFYMSVNLETKIKGLSSLPKVEDVVTKLKDGKALKASEWVMMDAIKDFLAQPQEGLEAYLVKKSDESNKKKRKVMQEIAVIKFSLILSKKWFSEFKSFDENKLSVNFDGQALEFTFDLNEKEEKI